MVDRPRLITPLVTVMVSLGVFVSACGTPGRGDTAQAGTAAGTLVISAQYFAVGDFQEGLAAVQVKDETTGEGGNWGFIDRDGKVVIRPQFYGTEGFSEGLAVVHLLVGDTVRVGYIDKTGRFAINPDFVGRGFPGLPEFRYAARTIRSFKEGLACVGVPVGPRNQRPNRETLDGYIDKKGQLVIEPRFYFAAPFSEGLAMVVLRDETGETTVGYIDESGEFAIEPKFDRAENFSEGFAEVAIGDGERGKWGYINKSGTFVITPFLEDEDPYLTLLRPSRPFSSGLAAARSGDKWEERGGGIRLKNPGKWGFISRTGDWVIAPRFEMGILDGSMYAGRFVEGLAYVRSDDLVGFIDSSGKWVIPPQFEIADEFSEGLAAVKRRLEDNRAAWGYINKQGVTAVPFRYADARRFSEGRAAVCVGENESCLWGFIGR